MSRFLSGFALSLVCSVAVAHPGHGAPSSTPGTSAVHFITEPVHAMPLVIVTGLAIAIGAFVGRIWQTRKS